MVKQQPTQKKALSQPTLINQPAAYLQTRPFTANDLEGTSHNDEQATPDIQIPEGEPLVLVLNESIDFSKRLPQIFSELLECTAFVNQNLDEPESSQLLLLLN
jgi:hypothetical protein